MDFPSSHPGHSRHRVVNVEEFSSTNLSSPHSSKFENLSKRCGRAPLSYLVTAQVSTLPRGGIVHASPVFTGIFLFLPVTWRMAPSICRFTSELF